LAHFTLKLKEPNEITLRQPSPLPPPLLVMMSLVLLLLLV